MSGEQTPASNAEWEQRFEAVARLYREAHEKLEHDPPDSLSAAVRARQAIEHIADYLHLRELGPAARNDMLDAKLKRIDAKSVFPRMVATHFGTVQIHANSIIHAGAVSEDPDPNLLKPCLLSLEIVVEWFFRDYLKRPAPVLLRRAAARSTPAPQPDTTPTNSTSTMMAGTRFGTGIGEFIPVWRAPAVASVLRLEGAQDVTEQCAFKIEDRTRTYFIGRTDNRSDGSKNDFALPKTWNSISRDQGAISTDDTGVVLKNTTDKNNVFVRAEMVPGGESRALRHGDSVQLGRCLGTFSDGRYYGSAPPSSVDQRTGLLSRPGLISEISGYLATQKQRTLFIVRCPEPPETSGTRDPERIAVQVAVAIHRHAPALPVARIGVDVAVLLPQDGSVADLSAVANRTAGAHCTSGYLPLSGTADQAIPRLEACLGALSRVAIAGREPTAPEDLTRYALAPIPLDKFGDRARPLFELGGGAILFALDEVVRMQQLAPQAVPVLELELVEMLGARMGPRDVVSFAGPGLLLFGTPGDAERFAQELAVAWHARGPVLANSLEIDRGLTPHLLGASDLDDIAARAQLLAQGGNGALGASSLPSPLALAARAIDDARDPLDRASAMVGLTELAWRIVAFVLQATVRGGQPAPAVHDDGSWPAPWRSMVRASATQTGGKPSRIVELAGLARATDTGGPLQGALDAIAALAQLVNAARPDVTAIERALPRAEKALRELFDALGPLRGWTLVAIDDPEIIDPHTLTQRIEYVDYTGPTMRGSPQRVTVTGFLPLGRFIYLVRWNEGLAIALEPYFRRMRDDASGITDLYVATGPVETAGTHRYRSASTGREIDLPVTAKQLGSR